VLRTFSQGSSLSFYAHEIQKYLTAINQNHAKLDMTGITVKKGTYTQLSKKTVANCAMNWEGKNLASLRNRNQANSTNCESLLSFLLHLAKKVAG
jgi:hypothetical protein